MRINAPLIAPLDNVSIIVGETLHLSEILRESRATHQETCFHHAHAMSVIRFLNALSQLCKH